jgi:hypothetical protein
VLDPVVRQELTEFGQCVFPDRDELSPVVTDQLVRPPTTSDGLLSNLGDPLGAGGQSRHSGQGIARVVIHQDADVDRRPVAQGGMLDVNVPLRVGARFLVALIRDAIRMALERVQLDRQAQAVKQLVHRFAADRADLARLQFGGDAVSTPTEQRPQREDEAHDQVRHLVMDSPRLPGLGTQGRKPFARHRAMPLPDATRAQRKMPGLGRLPARQCQFDGALLRDLFSPGSVVAHYLDTKLVLALLAFPSFGAGTPPGPTSAVRAPTGIVRLDLVDFGFALF